jgi:hypothetical protein
VRKINGVEVTAALPTRLPGAIITNKRIIKRRGLRFDISAARSGINFP